MCSEVAFAPKSPTRFDLLLDPSRGDGVYFIQMHRFKLFLKNFILDLKKIKLNYFNSLIEQLISVYAESEARNEHTDTLARIVAATTIVVTELPSHVFLKKLKINKFTDSIDYLILPNFILWDHNFIIFLNKAFNSKHENGLVDISSTIQKIKLTHGVIKDQLQNKNGYAGQFLYSTFLNTASFYASVQCFNGANEIVPPKASIRRYYGRDVSNVRAWTTRHPNISQLSTQVSDVIESDSYTDYNVKVGTGVFPGSNTDCDGDKYVYTLCPQPNSLIDLECLLYGDPRFSFILIDDQEMVCGDRELNELRGEFDALIESGAKGSADLVSSTRHYKATRPSDAETVAERAITSLNSYILSHNRVKVGGGDIYHNTTVLQNVYLKNDKICYKSDSRPLADVCALPSEFLFPEHLLDMFITK
nr:ORF64 lef-9 [Lymantria dispar multiple nucleopolyhedrovirus]